MWLETLSLCSKQRHFINIKFLTVITKRKPRVISFTSIGTVFYRWLALNLLGRFNFLDLHLNHFYITFNWIPVYLIRRSEIRKCYSKLVQHHLCFLILGINSNRDSYYIFDFENYYSGFRLLCHDSKYSYYYWFYLLQTSGDFLKVGYSSCLSDC